MSQSDQTEGDFELLPSLPVESPLNPRDIDVRIVQKFGLVKLEEELERFQFQFHYEICGHCSLSPDGELVICTNSAGVFTGHVGRGRCHLHEQKIKLKPRSPYSEFLINCSSIHQIFEEFQNIRNPNSLSGELAMARTVLTSQIQRLKEGSEKQAYNENIYKNILVSIESVRKLIQTISDFQKNQSASITLESISAFLWKVNEIIEQEIPDPVKRVLILDRIATEATLG